MYNHALESKVVKIYLVIESPFDTNQPVGDFVWRFQRILLCLENCDFKEINISTFRNG